ncbi:unnamed protein product [Linum trigynum]|uniref:Transmembrane protein n=1 Tax=Linum trigynum TaxID=586398 RepID=A0AAV2FNK9_9ROSI
MEASWKKGSLLLFFTAVLLCIVFLCSPPAPSSVAPTITASLPKGNGRKMLMRGIGREMKMGVGGSSSGHGGHGHHPHNKRNF